MTAEISPAEVVERLKSDGIPTVILGGGDTHGVMRGKRIPIGQLPTVLEHGLPICDVFWVMHVDESDLVTRPEDYAGYFPTESQGYPDIPPCLNSTALRIVPWHPNTALFVCDWEPDRRSWRGPDFTAQRAAPRRRRALETWATSR